MYSGKVQIFYLSNDGRPLCDPSRENCFMSQVRKDQNEWVDMWLLGYCR